MKSFSTNFKLNLFIAILLIFLQLPLAISASAEQPLCGYLTWDNLPRSGSIALGFTVFVSCDSGERLRWTPPSFIPESYYKIDDVIIQELDNPLHLVGGTVYREIVQWSNYQSINDCSSCGPPSLPPTDSVSDMPILYPHQIGPTVTGENLNLSWDYSGACEGVVVNIFVKTKNFTPPVGPTGTSTYSIPLCGSSHYTFNYSHEEWRYRLGGMLIRVEPPLPDIFEVTFQLDRQDQEVNYGPYEFTWRLSAPPPPTSPSISTPIFRPTSTIFPLPTRTSTTVASITPAILTSATVTQVLPRVEVEVPHINQHFRPPDITSKGLKDIGILNCVPASVAMVLQSLEARGIISNSVTDYPSIRRAFRLIRPNPGSGLSPSWIPELVQEFTNDSLTASNSSLDPDNWQEDIFQQLNSGYPVIATVLDWSRLVGSWQGKFPHSIVINGYDGENVLYIDPQDGEQYAMPTESFGDAWGYDPAGGSGYIATMFK